MERCKVITYFSKKFKVHEKNYLIHDLKIIVVLLALKIWRHYLYGVHVDVFMDHNILQYVFTQKDLNLFQRRWLEYLKGYYRSMHFHPGKINLVADALSRLFMGSVAHVEEERKWVSKGCSHAFLLRSSYYENIKWWCYILEWGVESSLVAEINENQYIDTIFSSTKGCSIISGLRLSPKEEIVCFAMRVDYVFLRWMS